jgi:hypothetical protein|tara:strand:+ start:255 stop:743 length:489 start_codon:yes stop_codon:yes gene_type:complete
MGVGFFGKLLSRVGPTIKSVKPAKNLKQRADIKESLVKGVDKHGTNMTVAQKGKFKAEGAKEISRIFDKYEKLSEGLKKGTVVARKAEKKAKGGRIGFKSGSGKSGVPAMDIKSKIAMKKKKKNGKTPFGMLSVKAGIDKNPNPTQADRIAGAKMKNKKKVI